MPWPPVAARGRPESGLFAGVGLVRWRRAGGFRLRTLPGVLLGRGLFGVLGGLEAGALATFEFVIRFAGHGSSTSAGCAPFQGAIIVDTREGASLDRRAPATQYPMFARRYFSACSIGIPRRRA